MQSNSGLVGLERSPEAHTLGVPRRVLVSVLLAMLALIALTALLSNWYRHERLARAGRYYERGSELAKQGRAREAIEQYRNALTISRDDPKYQMGVALALMQQKNWAEAAVYFHELLEQEPSDALPNLMLARISVSQEKIDQAVTYYHRAIYGRWPNDPVQHRLDTRLELIALLSRTAGAKRVIPELLSMAEENPRPEAKRLAARMLSEYGSASESAELYRELLRNGDREPDINAGLGSADLALGDYRAARNSLSRALRADPANADVRAKLALAEQVLALDPTLRGLNGREKLARSRTLLKETLSAVEKCVSTRKSPDPGTQQDMDRARRLLQDRRQAGAAAPDEFVSLAERLWTVREQVCGKSPGAADALTRVMNKLAAS